MIVLGAYEIDKLGRLIRRTIDLTRTSDHGADPVGDGTFRMVPSGDIVDMIERNRRLLRK